MDVLLREWDGNGGDLQLVGNDLAVVEGVENMPYLAMFGGANWWGNELFFQDTDFNFSAETEAVLLSTPLNSAGRVIIEAAIIRDLQFLIADVPNTVLNVQVRITNDNRLEIYINFNGREFYLLWNPLTQQITNRPPLYTYLISEDGEFLTSEDGTETLIAE